jgi:catechol 2,3-dioxygenase-like lactoylglutathione lyase family enzyme
MRSCLVVLLAVCLAAGANAQLAPANADGVRMGHMHLFVKDVDAQKAFWTRIMGARIVNDKGLEKIQLPGVYIVLTKTVEDRQPPAGSIVNHFGFVVKDMPGMLAKWKANNLTIEPTENPNEAYVTAPDGIRLEVYGVPDLPVAVQMNHIHYNIADIPGMQAWYAKVFGAKPGQRPCVACISKPRMIDTDDLPGVNLSFSAGAATLAGTKGRSLDHIGFDVVDLKAFARRLDAMGLKLDSPVRQPLNSRVKIAFLTDPWGTYIELTEGLEAKR